MEKINFVVGGLTCKACAKIVRNRLSKGVAGVQDVNVEENGNVTILSDNHVQHEVIEKALSDTDFNVINFK